MQWLANFLREDAPAIGDHWQLRDCQSLKAAPSPLQILLKIRYEASLIGQKWPL